MEKFIYEARPYIYGAISFYALFLSHNSGLMIASGIALGICCLWILNRRASYREQAAIIAKKMSHKKRY